MDKAIDIIEAAIEDYLAGNIPDEVLRIARVVGKENKSDFSIVALDCHYFKRSEHHETHAINVFKSILYPALFCNRLLLLADMAPVVNWWSSF